MLAFHADPAIKTKYLARLAAHEAADEIQRGYYWENGKGCAVGCTIHGSSHAKYETELGIPEMLARLEDSIFEGLSNSKAKKFPRRFLEAIPVGADLSLVGWQFLSWLVDTTLERHADPATRKACAKAQAVLHDKVIGKKVTAKRAAYAVRAACAAARAARAADAAYATADAAYAAARAADAAYAAAYAAYAARAADAAARAADAAYAAAYAAYAARAADAAARIEQSEKLIELLKGANA